MSSNPASAAPEPRPGLATEAMGPPGRPTQVDSAAAAPSRILQPGLRPLPDYELVHLLGQGGFGQVWKAVGPGGFPVALKFIHLGDDASESEIRSLEVMREIRHPQLVHLAGAWKSDGYLIVAMELGDRSLFQRWQEARRQGLPGIPRPELLEQLRDAARGIDYLNSINIRHRDIKPQNFLLVGGGLKVADFGLAKLVEHQLTSNSGAMTPAYAAPEFLEGRTSDRSDQYSLAVSYCQLRGGALPFTGSQANVMLGHLHEAPDLSMLPEAERPAVARALSKKPEDRWPSCKEFIAALAATPEMPVRGNPSLAGAEGDSAPETRLHYGRLAPAPMVAVWPAAARRPAAGLTATFCLIALAPLLLWSWPHAHVSDLDAHPAEEEMLPPAPSNLPASATNSLGMKLNLVPPGAFVMGAVGPGDGLRDDDGPAHEVRLTHPYYLAQCEVTQRQYEMVMGVNPAYFNADNGGGSEHPVERVSWQDATLFCTKLSALPKERGRTYRLPTEAEWEFACRAGSNAAFCFGRAASSKQANFNGQYPFGPADQGPFLGSSSVVGSYPANAWDFHDMHGNVWEWCADWSAPYDGAPAIDPRGPRRGHGRAIRGGSWNTYGWTCRSSNRSCLPPACRANDVGFRVAMTPQ